MVRRENESGTYERGSHGIYTLNVEGEEYHLYIKKKGVDTLYVYSDMPGWVSEDFKLSE